MAGSSQSLFNLIEGLKSFPVEPCITSKIPWELIQKAKALHMKTFVLDCTSLIRGTGIKALKGYLEYPAKVIYNRVQLPKAVQFLKDNKIDLVHINTLLASEMWAEAARKAGIPYIWHLREYVDKDHGRHFVNRKHTYRLLREADSLIAVSRSIQFCWEQRLNKTVELVYNGIPVQKVEQEIKINDHEPALHCLMVGRITESKGQLDAVKAIEILRNRGYDEITLTLVGYQGANDYERNLVGYVKEHHLEDCVNIVGYTYDKQEFYAEHEVGLLCSRSEAFGRVTVEYMAAGLVAVGTDSGGTPELIENGKTGYLYEYHHPEQLAEQLAYISDHRAEAEQVAKAGQQRAFREFDIKRTAGEVYNIYEKISF